jgi:hypothetical protein
MRKVNLIPTFSLKRRRNNNPSYLYSLRRGLG